MPAPVLMGAFRPLEANARAPAKLSVTYRASFILLLRRDPAEPLAVDWVLSGPEKPI